MKNRKEEFSKRMNEIKKQIDSRPSNCKLCQPRFRDGETEYICARTERETFFGTKADKCYGDCEHYEKNMGNCSGIWFSLQSREKSRTTKRNCRNLRRWKICSHG